MSGQEEGNEEEDTRVNNKLHYQWVQNEGIRARIGWQRMEKVKHNPSLQKMDVPCAMNSRTLNSHFPNIVTYNNKNLIEY